MGSQIKIRFNTSSGHLKHPTKSAKCLGSFKNHVGVSEPVQGMSCPTYWLVKRAEYLIRLTTTFLTPDRDPVLPITLLMSR